MLAVCLGLTIEMCDSFKLGRFRYSSPTKFPFRILQVWKWPWPALTKKLGLFTCSWLWNILKPLWTRVNCFLLKKVIFWNGDKWQSNGDKWQSNGDIFFSDFFYNFVPLEIVLKRLGWEQLNCKSNVSVGLPATSDRVIRKTGWMVLNVFVFKFTYGQDFAYTGCKF